MSPIVFLPGEVHFVQLVGATRFDSCVSPCAVNAGFKFNTNGTITDEDNSPETPWWSNAPAVGIGSNYEIRVTVTAGITPSGGSPGFWHDMASQQVWTVTRGSVGTDTSTLLVEIRDKATSTVQASGSYTLTAQVLP